MGAEQLVVLAVLPLVALVLLVLRAATREDVAVDALPTSLEPGDVPPAPAEGAAAHDVVRSAAARVVRVLPWTAAAAGVHVLHALDPQWAAVVVRPAGGVVVAALLAACVAGLVATTWRGADRAVRTALAAVALGAGANLLVVGVNGGMPLDVGAARAAGLPESALAVPASGHVIAGDGTRLVALGDVFPVPGARVVLSAGDVLLGVGAAGLLVATATSPRRREHAPTDVDARVAVAVLTERRSV